MALLSPVKFRILSLFHSFIHSIHQSLTLSLYHTLILSFVKSFIISFFRSGVSFFGAFLQTLISALTGF